MRFCLASLRLNSSLLILHTLAVAVGLSATTRVSGQTPPIPSGATESHIKAAAEEEGAARAKLNAQSIDGAPRVCATGYDMGPVSSGEFTIGGNLGGVAAVRAGRPRKIWWAPRLAARDMPPLLVRGRSLTNPRDTLRFTSAKVAWQAVPGGPPMPETERKYFFPSGITIPHSGRWLLIATSGPNWGCFILTVY